MTARYFLFGNVFRLSSKGALPDKQPADYRTAHFGVVSDVIPGVVGLPSAEAEAIKVSCPFAWFVRVFGIPLTLACFVL